MKKLLAEVSNQELIESFGKKPDENLAELIKRFEHSLECLQYPNMYYKKDVDDFVAGKKHDLQVR